MIMLNLLLTYARVVQSLLHCYYYGYPSCCCYSYNHNNDNNYYYYNYLLLLALVLVVAIQKRTTTTTTTTTITTATAERLDEKTARHPSQLAEAEQRIATSDEAIKKAGLKIWRSSLLWVPTTENKF